MSKKPHLTSQQYSELFFSGTGWQLLQEVAGERVPAWRGGEEETDGPSNKARALIYSGEAAR